MNLDYYLSCRKMYDNILYSLDIIIYSYNEILSKTTHDVYNKENKELYIFYTTEKNRIEKLKIECDENIKNLCCHDIIVDFIDIGPDYSKSTTIKYCKTCDQTF